MLFTTIDLNDINVRVANGDQLILNSPGYAVIRDNQIAFGETAEKLAHIYPLTTHDDFWYKLDQNSLHSASNDIRHNADLAYMHLTDIKEQSGNTLNWLIAIPSSFNQEQLALLLGLLDAANFGEAKLIDSALLATSSMLNHGDSYHVDIQLHQTVISHLDCNHGSNKLIASESSTELSMMAVYEQCAKLISESLIDQSRFDPLHNAETEQLLYEKIPACLEELALAPTMRFHIEYHGQSHNAVIKRETIFQSINPYYQAIKKKIQGANQIIFSHRFQQLPGFFEDIDSAVQLDEYAVFNGAKNYSEFLRDTDSSANYLTELPQLSDSLRPQAATVDNSLKDKNEITESSDITHILAGHIAQPLNAEKTYFTADHQLHLLLSDDIAYSITRNSHDYLIQTENDASVFVNGETINEEVRLELNDKIGTSAAPSIATLIKVI